jgi:hypothetical protein
MACMRSLFDDADERPALAARLAPALRSLAEQGVYFGGSSWKYEGWLGSIYTPGRYATRGQFSRKKFEAECLSEYAQTFPVVGGDFGFYQLPPALASGQSGAPMRSSMPSHPLPRLQRWRRTSSTTCIPG